MPSNDPENQVNKASDAEFQAAFAEFTEPKTGHVDPAPAATETPGATEANAPPAETSAPEAPVDTGSEAPPADASAKEAPAQTAEPAKTDPWDAVPPELKAEFERVKHQALSDASRVQALSRKVHALTSQRPPAPADEKKEETGKPDPLAETVQRLKDQYPEVGEALEAIVEAQKAALKPVQEAVERSATTEQERVQDAAIEALAVQHPDWRDIAKPDSDYWKWAEAQPEPVQKLATSWDASEVSAALDLFKAQRAAAMNKQPAEAKQDAEPKPAEAAATDVRRSQQLEGGRDVGSKPAPAASGPPDDFGAAFEYFAARRPGQFKSAVAR